MRKDMSKSSKSPQKESKNFFSQMYDRFTELGSKTDEKGSGEITYGTYQSNHPFYEQQNKDKQGKGEIDEKLVARVTGAKDVLKKAKGSRMGIFGDDPNMHLIDLLTLFRDRAEGGGSGAAGRHPLSQVLLSGLGGNDSHDGISDYEVEGDARVDDAEFSDQLDEDEDVSAFPSIGN